MQVMCMLISNYLILPQTSIIPILTRQHTNDTTHCSHCAPSFLMLSVSEIPSFETKITFYYLTHVLLKS